MDDKGDSYHAHGVTSADAHVITRTTPLKGMPALFASSGHCSTAVTMLPEVSLLVQVSKSKYRFCSYYICLLVLPCPRTLGHCVNECLSIIGLQLKHSGNIEEYPGPNNNVVLEQLLQSRKELLAKVTEIRDRQAS